MHMHMHMHARRYLFYVAGGEAYIGLHLLPQEANGSSCVPLPRTVTPFLAKNRSYLAKNRSSAAPSK